MCNREVIRLVLRGVFIPKHHVQMTINPFAWIHALEIFISWLVHSCYALHRTSFDMVRSCFISFKFFVLCFALSNTNFLLGKGIEFEQAPFSHTHLVVRLIEYIEFKIIWRRPEFHVLLTWDARWYLWETGKRILDTVMLWRKYPSSTVHSTPVRAFFHGHL